MKECTIIKNDLGQYVIGEITDEVGSRTDYESAAKEDGVTIVRIDGNTPRWATKLVDDFYAHCATKGLLYGYAMKTESGAVLVGLVD